MNSHFLFSYTVKVLQKNFLGKYVNDENSQKFLLFPMDKPFFENFDSRFPLTAYIKLHMYLLKKP